MSRSIQRTHCQRSCGMCRWNKSLCRRPAIGASLAIAEAEDEIDQFSYDDQFSYYDGCDCYSGCAGCEWCVAEPPQVADWLPTLAAVA